MTDKSRNQRPHSHNIDYYRPAWLYDANSIPSNYLNTYSPLLPTALPQEHVLKTYQSKQQQSGRRSDGNNYYLTEYSQISAIDTGFKKLKSNQIDILRELKKQYEILRKSEVDSQILINNQHPSQSQSNGQSRSELISSKQSHQRSSKMSRSVRKYQTDNRDSRLYQLQKKHLQQMLNNSMKKIEELLHEQIQLKKILHDYKYKLETQNSKISEYQFTISRLKHYQQDMQEQVDFGKKQLEKHKITIRELIENIGQVQNKLAGKQFELNKLLNERQHNKQTKHKLQLKNFEVKNSQQNQDTLRILERISEKVNESHEGEGSSQGVDKRENNNNNHNNGSFIDSVNLMMSKMTEANALPTQALRLQLNQVKSELQLLKNLKTPTNSSQPQNINYFSQLHYRIRDLQKTIQQQNKQKQTFLQQFKQIHHQHTEIKKQRDGLILKLKQLELTCNLYKEQSSRYQNQLNLIKNINVDLTQSQYQNTNLRVKLQQLILKQKQLQRIQIQFQNLRVKLTESQNNYEKEVRAMKRKSDQQQFKTIKAVQQGQFKLNLLRLQHQSQLDRLHLNIQQIKQTYLNKYNQQQILMKTIQEKLVGKISELQKAHTTILSYEKQKLAQIESLKHEHQQTLAVQRTRNAGQLDKLLNKISILTQSNQRYIQQSTKYGQLQSQLHSMHRIARHCKQTNQTITHLWQIKQTQYSNINSILHELPHNLSIQPQ